MDKNSYNNFYGYAPYSSQENMNNQYEEFNPTLQYEQGYMYYRFLTQQLEYKIKCKEYEKMCGDSRNERRA